MFVPLNWKRLESTLIEMTRTARLVMGMSSHRVGHGEPTKELAYLRIVAGPDHKVPMVRHQHHGKNGQRDLLPSFLDNPHERIIIFRLFTEMQPSNSTIEHMEHFTSWTISFRAGHPTSLDEPPQIKES